jgi:hypothetical protein
MSEFSANVNPASPPQTFTIDDVTHLEGDSGTTAYIFTVTKTGNTGVSSSVGFQTQDGTATLANNDYQPNTGTLNFAPTDTTQQLTVLVNGDTSFAPNENFKVNLVNPSNATIADAQGIGTITNDDALPSFSIDDVTHTEGDVGTTSYRFTVTKSGSTEVGSSVEFQTQDGTATIADNDYQTNSNTLNFGSSDTTLQITVLVNRDTAIEPNEAFTVHLSSPVNATITAADGTGTITNDDPVNPCSELVVVGSSGIVDEAAMNIYEVRGQFATIKASVNSGTVIYRYSLPAVDAFESSSLVMLRFRIRYRDPGGTSRVQVLLKAAAANEDGHTTIYAFDSDGDDSVGEAPPANGVGNQTVERNFAVPGPHILHGSYVYYLEVIVTKTGPTTVDPGFIAGAICQTATTQ